jgi:predicted transcriptional regulator
MKTFTIDSENNIAAYPTRKAAEANPGIAFTTADNLAELLGGDSKRLIGACQHL